MLQQTQTERVVPKYQAWLKQLPNFKSLAKASVAEVVRLWSGLGYNRRALALKKLAEIVTRKYRGRLPSNREILESFPGIGPYTAGAVRVFAFHEPDIFIETNIRRVFIHHFFEKKKAVSDEDILKLVAQSLPTNVERVHEWYWALMDYGAYLGGLRVNPNRRSRHYVRQSKFEGSRRQVRGQILKLLQESGRTNVATLRKLFPQKSAEIKEIVAELEREGFIQHRAAAICLSGESAR